MVQHVLSNHVRTAVPVLRRDLSMLRRAEEGVGESLSIPTVFMSQSTSFQSDRARGLSSFFIDVSITHHTTEKSREILAIPSSLPSPPASSPTSLSAGVYDDEALHQSPSAHFHSQISSTQDSQLISSRQRQSLATFASLSSPTDSQSDEILADPPTPPFDSLVADAISATKVVSTSPVVARPIIKRAPLSQSSASSASSASSTSPSVTSLGSHDLVEKQLTQSMDIDEDPGDFSYSSPRAPLFPEVPHLRMTRNISSEHTPPMPVRKQEWYGVRRSSRAVSGSIGPDNRHWQSTPSHVSSEHVFRSGTIQISPSPNGKKSFSSQQTSSQEDGSLEYASYPLQTQAPYQSQNYSP
ncbi:hypothetical protein H0H93_000076 [Arthromyces matolae]|nr:hypothetical protein H0H93_000076 [Arthromyces matolae]